MFTAAVCSLAMLSVHGDTQTQRSNDLAYLRSVARQVLNESLVPTDGEIKGAGRNTTGFALRVPGATQTFYPAFWVRDAAMMLGAGFVPADEVLGWVKVVAKTQPGSEGLQFEHGLKVPGYSIPDHITLKGEACWYPGAYTEQGNGAYGYQPPADDAFYFIQMAYEGFRAATDKHAYCVQPIETGWGEHPLIEICQRAFESVEADPKKGLVVCKPDTGETRVDWGFCDSIRKTGLCLMPSLLRWQAATRMREMLRAADRGAVASNYGIEASRIREWIVRAFYHRVSDNEGLLISATGLGKKDDVWAEAFAVWLKVLPARKEMSVANHLTALYRSGGVVLEGQVRHMPPTGSFGGHWEDARCAPGTYQNGGYWGTATGWMVAAIGRSHPDAADRLLHEYAEYIRSNRDNGAPFEWINPNTNTTSNANYAASIGLVVAALSGAG